MNCPKCNAVIDDDSKFCVHCGAPIEAEAASAEAVITTEAEAVSADAETASAGAVVTPEAETTSSETVAEPEAKAAPTVVESAAPTVVESAAPEASTLQKLLQDKTKLIGLIVGTALIIVGIYRIMEAGTTISSTSFGADFYTYTYQGIVAISRILASIEVTIGWVIIAIGAAIDVISLR